MSATTTVFRAMRAKRRQDDLALLDVRLDEMGIVTPFTLETMMTGIAGVMTGYVVRDLFLRRIDHMEEHSVQIEGILRNVMAVRTGEANLIAGTHLQALNELTAAMVGLNDADLDRPAAHESGTWTLREILEHLIDTHLLYLADARHALQQFHAGQPLGERPPLESRQRDPKATLLEIVDELERVASVAVDEFSGLAYAELHAPSRWSNIDIDVRFLLLRFASHLREHLDHILQLRAGWGRHANEIERLLGMCWQQNGLLEARCVGVTDEILDGDPGNDEWPIREILTHIEAAESYFRRLIFQAIEGTRPA